jgi:hypothetical protein
MVGQTKSAPLVAFLSSLSSAGLGQQVEEHPQTEGAGEGQESFKFAEPARPALDEDTGEGARAVILTILCNKSPISDGDLKSRSEFDADLYDSTLRDLKDKGLIAADPRGVVLTAAGVEAAARERDRLLSLW